MRNNRIRRPGVKKPQQGGVHHSTYECNHNTAQWKAFNHRPPSNDEVERRGVAPTLIEAHLSQSSTPSLADRRRDPRSLEAIVTCLSQYSCSMKVPDIPQQTSVQNQSNNQCAVAQSRRVQPREVPNERELRQQRSSGETQRLRPSSPADQTSHRTLLWNPTGSLSPYTRRLRPGLQYTG